MISCNLKLQNHENYGSQYRGMYSIDHEYLNEGSVPYGRRIFGQLWYIENPCISQGIDINQGLQVYVFVMFNRSLECSFNEQINNALNLGAKVALVANALTQQDVVNYDYGKSNSYITALRISQSDLLLLRELINSHNILTETNARPSMELYIDSEKEAHVEMRIYIQDLSGITLTLVREISDYIEILGDKVSVMPIYHFLDRKSYPFLNENDCLKTDIYCSLDPDGDGALKVASGRDLALEFYRQLILLSSVPKNIKNFWFMYMKKIQDDPCANQQQDLEICSIKIIKELFGQEIQSKVAARAKPLLNDYPEIESNQILIQERAVVSYPSIFLNGKRYKGLMRGKDIVEYACFSLSNPTEKCKEMLKNDGIELIIKDERSSSMGTGTIVFIVILLTSIIMFIGFFFYRRHLKQKLKQELEIKVNQSIQQYAQFVNTGESK